MATNIPQCALGITTASLSAWRDQALAAPETRLLAEHVPTCAACQQRLDQFAAIAQALQRQHAPNLRERVWRGMQPRMQGARRFIAPHAALLGGVSAALVVALISVAVLTFAQHHGSGQRSISLIPTASATATAASQSTAVGQPTATPIALTPAQAWGNYARQVLTSADRGGFDFQDIFPDGSACIGSHYEGGTPSADATEFATIPITHPTAPHLVYTSPQGADTLFARTDGRFIAWMSTERDSGGPDAGLLFVGYRDLQTQQVTTLASGKQLSNSALTGIFAPEMAVDHGYFIWEPETGGHATIAAINMLTGQSTTIVPHLTSNVVPDLQFSYPYVFYHDDTTAHLYNLMTSHDTVVAPVQPQVSQLNVYALDGATVLWAHGDLNSGAIDEIDHADQPGAKIQRIMDYATIGTHSQAFPTALAANDRLIAWAGAAGTFAWDRVQQRLVAISPAVEAGLFVRGTTFAFASGSDADSTYTFIDTSKLPVTAPQ